MRACPTALTPYLTPSQDVDVQLVASIGESCYVALDKGALVWEPCPHVLIIPIDHFGGADSGSVLSLQPPHSYPFFPCSHPV